jgi:hypothetical protein
MAHAYGPVGTIGEERSFLGSPPLPGYPDHSTWPFFPGWNRRLREHLALAEDRLPESRLLVVFPVESMYALAGPAADGIAREVFSLILALLDAQYPIDVLAPSACMSGRWTGNDFLLGGVRYRAVVYPSPSVVPQDIVPILRRGKTRLFCVGDIPRRSARGGSISPGNFSSIVGTTDLLQRLEAIPELRPVRGPANCWVTRTPLASGSLVTVTPSRHGFRYKGTLTLESVAAELPESSGLTRVVFPVDGTPVVTAPQD